MDQSVDREVMTWPMFGEASRALAKMVADDGFHPDVVLTIARGGLLPAGSIAYSLSVKNIALINVEYYTGINERLEFPIILPSPLDVVDLEGLRMLIVDDVADTGHTIKAVNDYCEGRIREVRTAVLYEKSISAVQCEYVWKRTDAWIDFPWSDQPPFMDRAGNPVTGNIEAH